MLYVYDSNRYAPDIRPTMFGTILNDIRTTPEIWKEGNMGDLVIIMQTFFIGLFLFAAQEIRNRLSSMVSYVVK